MMSTRVAGLRAAIVEAAATAAVTGVWLVTRGPIGAGWRTVLSGDLTSAPFDRVLVQLCAAALLACAAWGWLVTTVVVVGALHGTPGWASRGVPRAVRRLVLAACGVALVGGAAQPAQATPTPPHGSAHHHPPGAVSVLEGLPLPDRALGGGPGHRPAAALPGPTARSVVVRPGDTLWDLAAADLPSGAGNARIAERWHALYAANRTVIGPDPDLIEPGQTLHLPGKDRT